MLTIELEQGAEKELLRRARLEGKLPGQYAAELLEHSLRPAEMLRSSHEENPRREGFSKDGEGNITGLDGVSWRELAHEGHRF